MKTFKYQLIYALFEKVIQHSTAKNLMKLSVAKMKWNLSDLNNLRTNIFKSKTSDKKNVNIAIDIYQLLMFVRIS